MASAQGDATSDASDATSDAGDATSKVAVIINHGAFNPVHKHHIQMMIHAKSRLEMAGYQVISGHLGITNIDYIRRKKDAEPMLDEDRITCIQLACDELCDGDWLRPEPRGVKWPSAGRMTQIFQEENPGATIFSVCGSDSVVKLCKNGSRFNQPLVVVGRPGINNQIVKDTVGRSEAAGVAAFWVNELPGGPISSARVRHTLAEKDRKLLRQLCGKSLAEFLWDRRTQILGESALKKEGYQPPGPTSLDLEAAPSVPKVKVEKQAPRGPVPSPTLGGFPVVASVCCGLTGAPCAGKTSLAKGLLRSFQEQGVPCTLILQEEFDLGKKAGDGAWYWERGRWLSYWESPDATDWDAFEAAVEEARKEYAVVLVEGHCLFSSESLSQLLNCLVWMDIDDDACWKRRWQYPKGWSPGRYFSACLWPGHEEHQLLALGKQLEAPGCDGRSQHLGAHRCLGLNGLDRSEALLQRAYKAVSRWLEDAASFQ